MIFSNDDLSQVLKTWYIMKYPKRRQIKHATSGLLAETGELLSIIDKGEFKPSYTINRDNMLFELGDISYYIRVLPLLLDDDSSSFAYQEVLKYAYNLLVNVLRKLISSDDLISGIFELTLNNFLWRIFALIYTNKDYNYLNKISLNFCRFLYSRMCINLSNIIEQIERYSEFGITLDEVLKENAKKLVGKDGESKHGWPTLEEHKNSL